MTTGSCIALGEWMDPLGHILCYPRPNLSSNSYHIHQDLQPTNHSIDTYRTWPDITMCREVRYYCCECRKIRVTRTYYCSASTNTTEAGMSYIPGPVQRLVCINLTTEYETTINPCFDCRERARNARLDAAVARALASSPPSPRRGHW